jgi:hypothetical protein
VATKVFVLQAGTSKRIGTAIWTGKNYVITCAHVLRVGGYKAVPQTATQPGTSVSLEAFIEGRAGSTQLEATLLPCPWIETPNDDFPSDEHLEPHADVVALLLQQSLASVTEEVRFRKLAELEGGQVQCFGVTDEIQRGLSVTMSLAPDADLGGLRQLNWLGPGNAPIDQGFSGAPVVDSDQQIVGMVVTRRFPRSNDRFTPPLAHMIPIANVAELLVDHGLTPVFPAALLFLATSRPFVVPAVRVLIAGSAPDRGGQGFSVQDELAIVRDTLNQAHGLDGEHTDFYVEIYNWVVPQKSAVG